jgi:hypothetical protein
MANKKAPFRGTLWTLAQAPRNLRLTVAALVFATLAIPAIFSYYNYSSRQLLLAMILLDVCLYPTFRFLALREQGMPILPVLCLAFAVQYATPIFTQEPGIPVAFGFLYLDDADIVAALSLAILGVCSLQIAYYSLRNGKVLTRIPRVSLTLNRKKAEIFCLSAFVLSLLLGRLQNSLSRETLLQFSAIIGLLQNQLLVAIGILAWLVFTGRGKAWHKILLYVVTAVAAMKGFSTTMMESMMVPLAVLLMSKWFYTKRLPVSLLVVIGVLFLFLSPVKKNIRSAIVESGAPAAAEVSATDRAGDWISQAVGYWGEAFSGKRDLAESTSDAVSRTDLIHTFAHIYSLTPSSVPYQNGQTYSYLAIAWIPRAIWPEKPVANSANNFYAVAYDVSTEEGVKTSSFGATLIGEGYMNFGVPGVVIVMAFLGVVTSVLEDVFAGKESGPGGQAIFLATFVYFLNGIGTSAELLFGGLVQNLVASCILLWWVRARPIRSRQPNIKLIDQSSYKSAIS